MNTDPSAPATLVLVRDLLFATRISGAAQAIGRPVQLLRDPSRLAGLPGRRLIVDLNQPGAIQAAAAWKHATGGAVVGFVAHVDTSTISAAREAGLDEILPRGRFVQVLPQLLRAEL